MVRGLETRLAIPGDVLIAAGQMSPGLFFILRGTVRVRPKLPELSGEQLKAAREKFDFYDVSGGGSLDYRELEMAMKQLGCEMSKAELKSMISDFDADGTGEIEFGEFVEMLMCNKQMAQVRQQLKPRRKNVGLPGDPSFATREASGGRQSPSPQRRVAKRGEFEWGSSNFGDVDLSDGFFGEEVVLTGRPSSFTVRAITYSDFFLLPTTVFDAVMAKNDKMRRLVTDFTRARNKQIGVDDDVLSMCDRTRLMRNCAATQTAIKAASILRRAPSIGGGAANTPMMAAIRSAASQHAEGGGSASGSELTA